MSVMTACVRYEVRRGLPVVGAVFPLVLRRFWPGTVRTPSPLLPPPQNGWSSAGSCSEDSPCCCGSEPCSASWPTASRLPQKMSRPMTTWDNRSDGTFFLFTLFIIVMPHYLSSPVCSFTWALCCLLSSSSPAASPTTKKPRAPGSWTPSRTWSLRYEEKGLFTIYFTQFIHSRNTLTANDNFFNQSINAVMIKVNTNVAFPFCGFSSPKE